MKTKLHIAIFGFFLALPLAAGPFANVLAAGGTTAPTEDRCAIAQADLDAISAAELRGLIAELAARKKLLARVIGCAKAEAQTLQANLGNASVGDEAKVLRSQLSDRLNDAMNYYDIELSKVGDAGLAGTQAVAREVLAWRAGAYATLVGQIVNFRLWEKNQNLFDVAAARLNQMKNLVAFIEQAAPNADLQTAFANAQQLVRASDEENRAAQNALLQSLPPDESLAFIKRSLEALSAAYQKFFDVSTIIQTLLPAGAKQ